MGRTAPLPCWLRTGRGRSRDPTASAQRRSASPIAPCAASSRRAAPILSPCRRSASSPPCIVPPPRCSRSPQWSPTSPTPAASAQLPSPLRPVATHAQASSPSSVVPSTSMVLVLPGVWIPQARPRQRKQARPVGVFLGTWRRSGLEAADSPSKYGDYAVATHPARVRTSSRLEALSRSELHGRPELTESLCEVYTLNPELHLSTGTRSTGCVSNKYPSSNNTASILQPHPLKDWANEVEDENAKKARGEARKAIRKAKR